MIQTNSRAFRIWLAPEAEIGLFMSMVEAPISQDLPTSKLREETSFKRFKITAEDCRNREKWDAYQIAADAIIQRTSASLVPCTLVESNDKYYARVKVLKTLPQRIEAVLNGEVKSVNVTT